MCLDLRTNGKRVPFKKSLEQCVRAAIAIAREKNAFRWRDWVCFFKSWNRSCHCGISGGEMHTSRVKIISDKRTTYCSTPYRTHGPENQVHMWGILYWNGHAILNSYTLFARFLHIMSLSIRMNWYSSCVNRMWEKSCATYYFMESTVV